jgi:hypothetical protein
MIDLREPEVEDLCLPARRHEDVRGFQVPVDDALRVSGLERVGDLHPERHDRVDVERPASQPIPERLAVEQLHHDKMARLRLLDPVDGADVGMIQRRGRPRFTLETLQQIVVVGQRWR